MIDLRSRALRRFLLALAVSFAAGLAVGGYLYTRRDPVVAGFVPWTAAWPQHAVVEVNTGEGPQTLTDLDVATSHAAFTSPVVVLTPAMQADSLN